MATPGLVCAISANEGAAPGRDRDRDQLAEHARQLTVVADDEPGGDDRGRESRARHGSTGRSAGRNASTAACSQRDHRRRGNRPFVAVQLEHDGSQRLQRLALGVAAAEEELAPTAGLQPHGRTRRPRLGPSDPSGRARTSPSSGSRIGPPRRRLPSPRRCVPRPSRSPAIPDRSSTGPGAGRVRPCRAHAITPVVVGSTASAASVLSPSRTTRIATTPTAIATALTASHHGSDRDPRRPGIIANYERK